MAMMKGGTYVDPQNRRKLVKVIHRTRCFPRLLAIKQKRSIADRVNSARVTLCKWQH